jgi:hypothetical protein
LPYHQRNSGLSGSGPRVRPLQLIVGRGDPCVSRSIAVCSSIIHSPMRPWSSAGSTALCRREPLIPTAENDSRPNETITNWLGSRFGGGHHRRRLAGALGCSYRVSVLLQRGGETGVASRVSGRPPGPTGRVGIPTTQGGHHVHPAVDIHGSHRH